MFWDKKSNEFIGQAGFYFNLNSKWEIMIRLLPQFWRNGYGYEICSKLISFFNQNYSDNIYACINEENTASINLFKKLGFKYDGVEKFPKSKIFDHQRWAYKR